MAERMKDQRGTLNLLRAFARYRYWSLRGMMRTERRNDTLAQIGRWLGPVLRFFFVLALIPAALGLAVAAFVLGWALGNGTLALSPTFMVLLRFGLIVLASMTVFGPLILGSKGVEAENQRLLLLPISRAWLHGLRFLSTLADPWNIGALICALFLPFGLLVGAAMPGPEAPDLGLGLTLTAVVLIGTAGLLMILANAAAGFWLTTRVQDLMRDRRKANAALLLGIFALMAFSLGTIFLEEPENDEEFVQYFLLLNPFGELFATLLQSSLGGAVLAPLAALGALVLSSLGIFWLNQKAHDRLLLGGGKSAARNGSTTDAAKGAPREWRLPGVSRAAGAVAKTQIHTLWRTVPGKLAIAQTPFLVLFAGFLLPKIVAELPFDIDNFAGVGLEILPIAIGVTFMLIGIQQFLFNNFAIDASGLTLQSLIPLSTRDFLRGKIAAWGILLFAAVAISTLLSFLLTQPSWPGLFWSPLLVILATLSCSAILIPSGLLLSALFPKESDISRSLNKNQPHFISIILGLMIFGVSWSIPMAIIGLALVKLQSLVVAIFGLLFWLTLSWLAGWGLLHLAGAAWERRRESILLASLGR